MRRGSAWPRRCAQGISAILILGVCSISVSVAQEKEAEKRELVVGKWYPSLESGLNLTQSSYSANWAGGDKGSVVWTLITNGTLENQLYKKVNWLNTLKLAYGQTHQQQAKETGDRVWDRPAKSTDLLDFETVSRFTLGGFVDPFASFRLESQFQGAPDSLGRTLSFNPLKFKESAGIARKFIDEKERSLLSRLGFTFRQSSRRFFTDPAPSRATGSETTNDGGFEWVTDWKTRVLQDKVAWTSKLGVYQPVFFSGKKDLDDIQPEDLLAAGVDSDVSKFSTTADLDWENIFSTQITKLVSVGLYTRWVYDKYDNAVKPLVEAGAEGPVLENPGDVRGAIRKAGQFKQTLAVGITYRFF